MPDQQTHASYLALSKLNKFQYHNRKSHTRVAPDSKHIIFNIYYNLNSSNCTSVLHFLFKSMYALIGRAVTSLIYRRLVT